MAVTSSIVNDEVVIRLVGALMLGSNDEWRVARRCRSLEMFARVNDHPTVRLPAVVIQSSLDLS
jgi:hypothetical protein